VEPRPTPGGVGPCARSVQRRSPQASRLRRGRCGRGPANGAWRWEVAVSAWAWGSLVGCPGAYVPETRGGRSFVAAVAGARARARLACGLAIPDRPGPAGRTLPALDGRLSGTRSGVPRLDFAGVRGCRCHRPYEIWLAWAHTGARHGVFKPGRVTLGADSSRHRRFESTSRPSTTGAQRSAGSDAASSGPRAQGQRNQAGSAGRAQ